MRKLLIASAAALLVSCGQPQTSTEAGTPQPEAAGPITPVATEAPAGAYKLDASHASLDFRVNHIGMSNYTARFSRFDASLQFDPANPAAMRVEATIDPRSLTLPAPPPGFVQELLGAQWLDAGQFPMMSFTSTAVELTGANTARITGNLTLHGITKPVTLEATFNGGYAGNPYDPQARIGFSARGALKRSDFGIALGIPAPGTTTGVSDQVDIAIEAEFTGPPWTPPAVGAQ